jgi:hypothetical protein
MLYTRLAHAAGIAALALKVSGLLKPSERSMLKVSAWASALWSLNSLLIGAPMAAASAWRRAHQAFTPKTARKCENGSAGSTRRGTQSTTRACGASISIHCSTRSRMRRAS